MEKYNQNSVSKNNIFNVPHVRNRNFLRNINQPIIVITLNLIFVSLVDRTPEQQALFWENYHNVSNEKSKRKTNSCCPNISWKVYKIVA